MYKIMKISITVTVLILLSMILSQLIVSHNYKIIFLVCSLIFLFLWIISCSEKDLIAIIIVASFLPIKINITTTSLGSITQYVCILCFGVYFINAVILNKKIIFNYNLMLLLILLALSGLISTLGVFGNASIFRESFWSLILLFAAILFLVLIDSIVFKDDAEKHLYIIKWLDLIVLCTCLQILIGTMVHIFPETGEWFTIFFQSSEPTGLKSTLEIDDLLRMRTISLPTEAVGEFCAILIPYVCYRLAFTRGLIYTIAGLIVLLGIALSGTRSGMILAVFGIITYYVFVEKSLQIKTLHLSIIVFTSVILILYGIDYLPIISRTLSSYETFMNGGDMGAVLNRKFMFEGNWSFFIKSLSCFGNGLISPVTAGYLSIDFHNVYLTIIYQFGVIGSLFYFSIPLFLLIRLLSSFRQGGELLNHTKVLIISLLIFLINETKFEFTRKLEYVIIIWILFSVYYLNTKHFSNGKKKLLSAN